MAYLDTYADMDARELRRWAACAIAVVLLHAVVVVALTSRPDPADTEAGSPVVMVELAPLAVAPQTQQNDLAPGPDQQQPEMQQHEEQKAKPEQQEPELKLPQETPTPESAVALPPPQEKPPEQRPEKVEQEPVEATPVPTAPPPAEALAPRPAAPSPGRVMRPSAAAVSSWQRSLAAHLERYKRYPTQAQARGENGIVNLAFSIDRQGRVVSSHILRGSGSQILDEETLAMLKRAEPLPRPPSDIADNQLSFVLPVRYNAKR